MGHIPNTGEIFKSFNIYSELLISIWFKIDCGKKKNTEVHSGSNAIRGPYQNFGPICLIFNSKHTMGNINGLLIP